MGSPSFVSKARTAFHSAAAKAERVLSDLKQPDRPDSDKTLPGSLIQQAEDESPGESRGFHESKALRWRPLNIGTKQEWQDRKQEWQDSLRSIGKGKKGVEDTEKTEYSSMAFPYYDENLYILNMKNDLEAKINRNSKEEGCCNKRRGHNVNLLLYVICWQQCIF